jgi:hypothetical protein
LDRDVYGDDMSGNIRVVRDMQWGGGGWMGVDEVWGATVGRLLPLYTNVWCDNDFLQKEKSASLVRHVAESSPGVDLPGSLDDCTPHELYVIGRTSPVASKLVKGLRRLRANEPYKGSVLDLNTFGATVTAMSRAWEHFSRKDKLAVVCTTLARQAHLGVDGQFDALNIALGIPYRTTREFNDDCKHLWSSVLNSRIDWTHVYMYLNRSDTVVTYVATLALLDQGLAKRDPKTLAALVTLLASGRGLDDVQVSRSELETFGEAIFAAKAVVDSLVNVSTSLCAIFGDVHLTATPKTLRTRLSVARAFLS